jgi:hypothetical protein
LTTETHILLLFDCCFAGQAGRGREQRPTRIELLAAAAMSVKTPLPGPRSFTTALIREITAGLEKDGQVIVSDLNRRLMSRESDLFATPIHVNLGQDQKSIRLEPLRRNAQPNLDHEASGPSFQLLIRTRAQLDKSDLVEIGRWLGEYMPSTVATLHVEKVLETTKFIQSFIEGVCKGDEPLIKGLKEPAVVDVLSAWDNALAILKGILVEQRGLGQPYRDTSTVQKLAERLLEQLDTENSDFVDLLEQKLLYVPMLAEEAINSTAAATLGMANQLRLRQMICASETSPSDIISTKSPGKENEKGYAMMQEYRKYGPYLDPAQIPALTNRVCRLAELLNAPKSSDFRSLRCAQWSHNNIEHQYVLHFEIPSIYESQNKSYQTLQSIIQKQRGSTRPSLDERFRMAFLLAKAVGKWHSVGWLHQGISGPNIIFFSFKDGLMDYSSPFLGGFEFARPDSDPSVGYAADDVAFNVYRHPARQGETRNGHRKIHDIYSLGVVLLEIGLWQRAFDIVNMKENGIVSAQAVAQKLRIAAAERLSHYAGRSYKAAVEACLNSDFSMDMESELGRSFKERVLDKLVKGMAIT